MEEQVPGVQNLPEKNNLSSNQIAGAILIAGILIAGAILLKGSTGSVGTKSPVGTPVSKSVGLNVKSFQACLASGKFRDKIQASIDDGVKAGVEGTPSSLIVKDGKVVARISGAQPYDKVIALIKEAKNTTQAPLPVEFRPVSGDDHITGNAASNIVVVEYSDLECPFCKVFHQTMRQVIEAEDVAWVYRHYPIPQLHAKAFHEAEATECAWEQKGNEGFWKYTDKLFELTPSNDGFDATLL